MSSALNVSASASDTTVSPGLMLRPRPVRWGGTIFFKVEEIVFEAPRCRFVEHSEVFETMFHLPARTDGAVDGRDEEHPIVLEGYQAVEFEALLKFLYPTIRPDDFIAGTLKLQKQEWIGVLNLSTRWSMKKIRKHAVDEVSKLPLSPMEKVGLGREHQVAHWFREGLTELVSEHPIRPLTELKSQLGVDTACTLLWIKDQTLLGCHGVPLSVTGLTLGMLVCLVCPAAMFAGDINCHSCSQTIALHDSNAIFLANGFDNAGISTSLPATGPVTSYFTINLNCVMCRKCSKCAIDLVNRNCVKCSRTILPVDYRLHYQMGPSQLDPSQKILEEFGDEIASYESWDE